MSSGLQQWLDEQGETTMQEVEQVVTAVEEETLSTRQIVTHFIEILNQAEHNLQYVYNQATQLHLYDEPHHKVVTDDFELLRESLFNELGNAVYLEEHSL